MGIDFEVVAYRGQPASVERLAALLARYTPYARLFRHATAADVKSPVARDLHVIAFYDDQLPAPALAPAREAMANGGSLADLVKQAWALGQGANAKTAEAETSSAELARELSRGGEAFLLGYADHSCIGIYAQFRDGALVFPASIDEIHAEHDDYTAWPSQQWSHALGQAVDLDKIIADYFPDASEPSLCRVECPDQPIPFDADRYSIGISESM